MICFIFFCSELIEELVRATDLKFGRGMGNTGKPPKCDTFGRSACAGSSEDVAFRR